MQYLAPGLFLVDSFRNRLGRLFPSRVLLQPLARYLLHPSNAIWDRITRVYEGYLFPADLRVGVEVAVLGRATVDEKANQVGKGTAVYPGLPTSLQFPPQHKQKLGGPGCRESRGWAFCRWL